MEQNSFFGLCRVQELVQLLLDLDELWLHANDNAGLLV
jgi:hypothetical protein